MALDLFGDEVRPPLHPPTGKGSRKTGYAATPGSGPAGKNCKQCEHYFITSMQTAKAYRKCGLMRAAWTHGPGTDIKASAPACAAFVVAQEVKP